jgi:hypothetical protein
MPCVTTRELWVVYNFSIQSLHGKEADIDCGRLRDGADEDVHGCGAAWVWGSGKGRVVNFMEQTKISDNSVGLASRDVENLFNRENQK